MWEPLSQVSCDPLRENDSFDFFSKASANNTIAPELQVAVVYELS